MRSAHEMVRTESYEDMYMSGDGENEGNEDGGKNELYSNISN